MAHERIENNNLSEEIMPQKEADFRLKHIITISGNSGTGKSLIIDALASACKLLPSQVIKVGEMFREQVRKETGKELAGFYKRSIKQDEDIDSMQLMLLSGSRPKIIDSRLGGWLAMKIKNSQLENSTPITCILLTGDKETMRRRAYNRNKKLDLKLTYEVSRQREDEREKLDLEQLANTHPELNGINPLDPINQNLYDFHLDVTTLSKEDAVKMIYEFLIKRGAIEKIQHSRNLNQSNLPFQL